LLPDDVDAPAIKSRDTLPEMFPDKFREFEQVMDTMREKLPLQLHAAQYNNQRALAQEALRMALADLSIAKQLSAPLLMGSAGIATMYNIVTNTFGSPVSQTTKSSIPTSDQDFHIEREDILIADRLANKLLSRHGPMDLDLLREYRQSNCHGWFRHYVRVFSNSFDDRCLSEDLFEALLKDVDARRKTPHGKTGLHVSRTAQGAIGGLLGSSFGRLMFRRLSRRKTFRIGAAITLGAVAGLITSNVLPEKMTIGLDETDRMIALITSSKSPRPTPWK
jgi:hypothetical protein